MAYARCIISSETRQDKAFCGSSLGRGTFVNFYHKTQVIINTCNIVLSADETQFNTDDFRSKLASNLGQLRHVHIIVTYLKMCTKEVNMKIKDIN